MDLSKNFFTSYRFWRAIWIRDLSLAYDVLVFFYYQSSQLTWRDYNPCPFPIFYQNFSFGQQFEEISTGFRLNKPIYKKNASFQIHGKKLFYFRIQYISMFSYIWKNYRVKKSWNCDIILERYWKVFQIYKILPAIIAFPFKSQSLESSRRYPYSPFCRKCGGVFSPCKLH